MANLAAVMGHEYNADDAQESSAIPTGRYKLAIAETNIRPNKASTGHVLFLTIQVIEGPISGQNFNLNLNIVHEKPSVQAMAQAELSRITKAINKIHMQDTDEMIGLPFVAAHGLPCGWLGACILVPKERTDC